MTAFQDSFMRQVNGDTSLEKLILVVLDLFYNFSFSIMLAWVFAQISAMKIEMIG